MIELIEKTRAPSLVSHEFMGRYKIHVGHVISITRGSKTTRSTEEGIGGFSQGCIEINRVLSLRNGKLNQKTP
jgi:hypothetical protein